jgi:5-methylcytosine-specific restriction enzyme subunit McrC
MVTSNDRNVHTLAEHEPTELALTPEDVDFLQSEFDGRISIRRTWTGERYELNMGPYVGVLALPSGTVLQSHPKVPIASLFFMLATAYDLPDSFRDETVGFERIDDIYEFIAEYFAGLVEDQITKGLYRTYAGRSDNLNFVRGRIRFAEDVARNSVLRHRTYCDYAEYTWDVPENQAIRQVCQQLSSWGFRGALSHRYRNLDSQLSGITSTTLTADQVTAIPYNRFNDSYRQIHHLCALFIDGSSLSDNLGISDSRAFLVNMNSLFETFITRLLEQRLSNHVHVTDQERTWFDDDRTVVMYPDLVLRSAGRIQLIGDCKYKKTRPDDFVNQDVYQLNAYCAATGCSEGVLIYPRHELAVDEFVSVRKTGIRLGQVSIDLGLDSSSLVAECERFVQIIERMVGPQESDVLTVVAS